MTKNAFIICEYNPFHNGHKYHIDATRKLGAENIICIMNGNFVQRGEPAIYSKQLRAKWAVENGADLVIELPVKYGISSADFFAYGGVNTAIATGLDGTFSFGATADKDKLRKSAEILINPDVLQVVNSISLKKGKSYPAALDEYFSYNSPELSDTVSESNNILAVEYIKHILKTDDKYDFVSVIREGVAHDSNLSLNSFASAKSIREFIKSKNTDAIKDFIPTDVFYDICNYNRLGKCSENERLYNNCIYSRLALMQANDFTDTNGVSQGLDRKIYSELFNYSSLEKLYDAVKSKRFTHSRIRQIFLAAALGVKKSDLNAGVNYIRVLGFNSKGRLLLREMQKTSKIPVITNLSDINSKSSLPAQRDKELDIISGKMYDLCLSVPDNINTEIRLKPFFEE